MTTPWSNDKEAHPGPEPPRSSAPQRTFALEIYHVPSGQRRHHVLTSSRVVIGQAPRADVALDDPSVSVSHAELVKGPLGQWWIHDLDSEGGTFMHGRRLREQLLTTGDEIVIGCYRLRLTKGSSASLPAVDDGDWEKPAATVRFGSVLPPALPGESNPLQPSFPPSLPTGILPAHPISAVHLSRVVSLTRELMDTADAARRWRMLCEFLVTEDFCVESAAVVRLTGPTTARVLDGPVRRSGGVLPIYLSPRVTSRFWEMRQAVCQHTKSRAAVPGRQRRSNVVTDCPYLSGQVRDPRGQLVEPSCACGGDGGDSSGWPSHVSLVFPLGDEAQFIDGLYVDMVPADWSPEWCAVVALVAEAFQQAELVWQMRSHVRQASSVERELEMARQIQQSLVPQQAHFDSLNQRLEVVVGFEPCHWVGGDYADAVLMPDGRVLLAIADVCGKGMQAALVASSLHTFVRATVDLGTSLPDLVRRINRHMCRYLPDHVFITMLCVAADLVTGDLEIVSAGHPPAFIGEPNGRVFSLEVGHNVGLGFTDTEMVSGMHRLRSDQTLFLYTDGLTEAINKQREPLGAERLAQMFSAAVTIHGARGPHAMKEAVLTSLRSYRGSLLAHDDTTFLMARLRLGSGPPRP